MEMIENNIGAHTTYTGSEVYELAANKHFKIKASEEEKYSAKCPAGKKMSVTVSVVVSIEDE